MIRTLSFLAAFAAPSVALAHPGHEHVGTAASHHSAEMAALAIVAVAGVWLFNRLARRDGARN